MKILITGATGFVGKRIVETLFKEGHEVVVTTRSIDSAQNKLPFPIKFVQWDYLTQDLPHEAIDGVQSVINLMGENISNKRWSHKQKEKIYQSRVLATKKIVKAVNDHAPQLQSFVSTSAIGIYQPNTATQYDENGELAQNFLSKVCGDWEKALDGLPSSVRKVVLRVGVVFGPDDGALKKLLPIFKIGAGGPIGSGKAFMSWIHVDDLANLFIQSAIEQSYEGIYNAVSPEAATNKEFTRALANSVGLPAFFPVPPFMLQLLFGEMSSIILDSLNITPKRLIDQGHKFHYPNLGEALDQITGKKKLESYPLNNCESFKEFQFIPRPINEVFDFFSNPNNLEKITPSEMGFKVRDMSTDEIQKGTIINYGLTVHGIPLKWQSTIAEWNKGHSFVDIQTIGPYSKWHHTHTFTEVPGGTLIEDSVLFKLPMGPLGYLFGMPFVSKDIRNIFSYRKTVLAEKFNL